MDRSLVITNQPNRVQAIAVQCFRNFITKRLNQQSSVNVVRKPEARFVCPRRSKCPVIKRGWRLAIPRSNSLGIYLASGGIGMV